MKKLRVGYITLLAVLVLGVTGMAKEKVAKEKPAKKGAAKSKSLVVAGAEVKKMAGDFKFTEGPAGDAVGDVYFSDIPNNRILKWSLDGKLSTFLENSGGANGLYFDKNGNLLACQGEARRLVSISPKGEITVLAEKYNGKKFNSPNDLWIDPKGGVYFSDPRYGNREGMEQDGEHVYYLKPDRKTVIRVISDMVRPNGLIGTPNGKTLYVTDNGAGKTYSYKVNKDGTLTGKQLFAPEAADGMTIDDKGNVYLTTNAVAVYDKKGTKIEEIPVAEQPANVTFAGKDNNTLFITARTSLYAVDMQVKGAATPLRAEGQKAPKPKATKETKKTKESKKAKEGTQK
ncbi:MAG: SMP-30/gluconolactonase/LRE family protein [Phycisphaerae bacterium]|nr:SMP-30/gluconolactonase/LRE family protein [Phycisphaerae bacterium]